MQDSDPTGAPFSREEFDAHVAALTRTLASGLERWAGQGGGAAGVVFDAGVARFHPRDDQLVPFRPCPHLARWVPAAGPGDLLCVRPGAVPVWLRVVERDYWHEPPAPPQHPVVESYAIQEVESREAALRALGSVRDCAYVGPDPGLAEHLGIPAGSREPRALLAELDWARAYKTTYEIACTRLALQHAARGHVAAREAAAERASEHTIHLRYLEAAGLLEGELPYPSIIAWDDRAAILHYQSRRRSRPDPGATFLIDAGASAWGYACDVTRTYAFEPDPRFAELLAGMERLQAGLTAAALPGQSFVALHARALAGVATLLRDVGVLTASCDEALDRGWIDAFMPHGLGHHLGLQVHDVAGRQVDREGTCREPPERWPYLRTTRELESGHVVTIEPGLYFVPSLLAPLRAEAAGAFDWGLLRELQECGGIRVEDDVWIRDDGPVHLSREAFPP